MSTKTVTFKIWRGIPVTTFLWKSKSFQTQRTICTSMQNKLYFNNVNHAENKAAVNQKTDWNKTMSEAEKVVGCSTSFLSLRWLLSDEIANVALHLRKLVGSNHPLLKTAKSIIYNDRNTQAFGFIVLLISKAAGHLNAKPVEEDKAAGVLHSQRALAEVIEMIRISNLIHRRLININTNESLSVESSELNNMTFGNKIALLCGDYLLSNSYAELAQLRNQDVWFLISSAIQDLCQAEFVASRDNQNFPIPSKPPKDRTGYALKEWTLLNVYGAELLGKSCQGTLQLAGHSKEIQEEGYKFGKHLALAWQASLDLGLCINKDKEILHNLCAAPIMFHVEHDPLILLKHLDKGSESVENVNYLEVLEIVTDGPGIGLTKDLIKEHSQKAMEVLNVFKQSDARKALSNIIVAIGDL